MIGLFPAAGKATRLGLPTGQSKEVIEIAPGRHAGDCLLNAYAAAGLDAAVVLTREGKEDIFNHYQQQPIAGLPLRVHLVGDTPSTLHTLQAALDHIPREAVALGFPDIQFNAPDAFVRLRRALEDSTAEIVLGLFATDRPDKVDMVEVDASGAVRDIVIKPTATELKYSWVLAVWRPRFTQWLRDNLAALEQRHEGELFVGHALQAVMAEGWEVQSLTFADAKLLDIGTRDDLARAAQFFGET